MTNEIKEILECLEKYGQLTPDAIDDLYYIRDYITNLQEEKKRLLESADCLSKGYSNLEKRIDKAVEYNKKIKNKIEKQLDNGQSYDFIVAGYLAIFHDTLEEILRGDE